MSILIKGIDMPKGDEVISLVIASDKWCAGFNDKYERIDAQAIPIPKPHGDLVDREWLKGVAELNKDIYNEAIVDLDDLWNAPTVIEGE